MAPLASPIKACEITVTTSVDMNLLLLLALLIPPSCTAFIQSHLSDSLRLKCDALPYRTAAIGNLCYFAVNEEIENKDATSLCSSKFPGSRVANNAPSEVFKSMMVEKSKFHVGADSSRAKQVMCGYDSGYKCAHGKEESTLIPGKCVSRLEKQQSYLEGAASCRRSGMKMASVGNEIENLMIRGALDKAPAWIRNPYNGDTTRKWGNPKSYARYGTCEGDSKNTWPASQMQSISSLKLSSVVDKSGYWRNEEQKNLNDVICVRDAVNEFTQAHSKLADVDTCILETFNITYGKKEICPRAKNLYHSYFIRAVLEDGSIVTLDNDMHSLVRYDEVKKMWYYHYDSNVFRHTSSPATTFVYFTSAVCGVANPGNCPCTDLPPAMINTSPVLFNDFGSCPSGKNVWVVYEKFPDHVSYLDASTTNIFCQGGKWFVREKRHWYAYIIVAASCSANNPPPVTIPPPTGIASSKLTDIDQCVVETSNIAYGVKPICPNAKSLHHSYIIRAVLEDGSLATLDNDMHSHVHYDDVKKMWYYHYQQHPAVTFVYFTSAVCAVANPDKCPCTDLPPAMINTSPVLFNDFGSCPSGKTLWLTYEKFPTLLSNLNPETTNIFCQGGKWFVREKRHVYAYIITAASCV